MSEQGQRRVWWRRLVFVTVAVLCGLGVNQALIHPDTPLPPEWNPTKPFSVSHALSPLTQWKLAGVEASAQTCLAALEEAGAQFTPLPAVENSDQCHIRNRVRLTGLGEARMAPVETRCDVALRLALWERQSLTPLAKAQLGATVAEVHHFSSYNCRKIRTSRGVSDRWSTHASARAIDISGVTLADGTRVDLRKHWEEEGARSAYLKAIQNDACAIFGLVLGPNYNALHADHFHIQMSGQGCR